MTRFRYRAADAKGAVSGGILEASDAVAARTALRARALLPLSLTPERRLWRLPQIAWSEKSNPALRLVDVTLFTRQMATLISSGIQIEAALAAIGAQSKPRLSTFCHTVRQEILDGATLSRALRDHAPSLDRYYLTSIEAGERAGRLGLVLERLAEHVETRQRNQQTITLALIYPAILVLVSVAVIVALLVFVLPDIVKVFAARGADLPGLTQAMIVLSTLLSDHAVFILAGLLALGGGGYALTRQPKSRLVIDQLLWRVALCRQIILVQFTGTLATLTQSGVALSDALGATTATVSNTAARAHLIQVAQDVRDGAALSQALAERRQFSALMITMIASGEASGTLPQMLGRYADNEAETVQAKVKTLVGLVEPLVLLGMGGVVMMLVLAILLPIVNLNTLVG